MGTVSSLSVGRGKNRKAESALRESFANERTVQTFLFT